MLATLNHQAVVDSVLASRALVDSVKAEDWGLFSCASPNPNPPNAACLHVTVAAASAYDARASFDFPWAFTSFVQQQSLEDPVRPCF